MAIDRRQLLRGATAAAAGFGLFPPTAAGTTHADEMFAAARRTTDGRYGVAILAHDGRELRAAALPGRGHDLAVCPVTRRVVAFARRPGSFAIVLEAADKPSQLAFTTPPDRHFYGHGIFARDGRLLYTTENDFEHRRGVIGVYDAARRFRRIGELPSHGIGPHDLALLSDGRTLVVANGGLAEHPDIGGGRRVLNPDAIATSVAFVDLATGDLLERHELPHAAGLSLRHLEVAASDTVVIGAQEQSPSAGARSIVLKLRRRQELTRIHCGDGDPLGGYVSSLAIDTSGTIVAVTSSRTGTALLLDVATGRIVGSSRLTDVSGVAPRRAAGSFLLTSGSGAIVTTGAADGDGKAVTGTRSAWDNHAVALS